MIEGRGEIDGEGELDTKGWRKSLILQEGCGDRERCVLCMPLLKCHVGLSCQPHRFMRPAGIHMSVKVCVCVCVV